MASGQKFVLEVSVDASQVSDFNPAQQVKVVAIPWRGEVLERFVNLSVTGQGSARFTFNEAPGALQVAIGPHSASPADVKNMQTISVDVPASSWQRNSEIKLPVVPISSNYWNRWLHLCRHFTGLDQQFSSRCNPVFGASITVYDGDGMW